MKLSQLIQNISSVSITGSTDIDIDHVTFDSRDVKPNSLFFAIPGTQVDGHKFITKAVESGAVAVLCEHLPELTEAATFIQVEDSAKEMAEIVSEFYGQPSQHLKLVGVTGTNGKTTIATLLYDLFTKLGYKTGLMSTVKVMVHDEEHPATHTTPDVIAINKNLKTMVEAGCDYCFMEVSSHAIDQDRVAALQFVGGIFTNLTRDHLDYHETFSAYRDAKKKFFDGLGKDAFALTNKDDKNGAVMLQNTNAEKCTYSIRSIADFKAKIVEKDFNGMQLDVNGTPLWIHFVGDFNASNLLAVYGAAIKLNQDPQEVMVAISTLKAVDGRFETVKSPNGVIGIVDYAHTPDAVINVIEAINKVREGAGEKLITVIGAGGNRDKGKRPLMAQEALKGSEMVILTSDNPRFENPEEIIRDMEAGVSMIDKGKVLSITDRQQAIKTAALMAKPGDIILIAGKGHETYQEVKGVRHHFDDREVLRNVFNEIMN